METFLESLGSHNFFLIYLVLFFLIFLENTIPFVPGDAVLIFSAYLSGRGHLIPVPAFLITVFGSLAGFSFIFLISRYWRRDFQQNLPFGLAPHKAQKYKILFQRHENWSLVIGRIVPGSRLFLAAAAGLTDISIRKAALLTGFGILIWNSVIFFSGMLLGTNWVIIKKFITQYSVIVNVTFLGTVLIIIGWKLFLLILRKNNG